MNWLKRMFGIVVDEVKDAPDPEGYGPVGDIPVRKPTPRRRCPDCMGHGKYISSEGVKMTCSWCSGVGHLPDYGSKHPLSTK